MFQCTLTQVGGAVNCPLSVERIVHTKNGWDSCYVPLSVERIVHTKKGWDSCYVPLSVERIVHTQKKEEKRLVHAVMFPLVWNV